MTAVAETEGSGSPERALFAAVIIQAMHDAMGPQRPERRSNPTGKEQRDAREWLLSGSDDFRRVCGFASIDAVSVLRTTRWHYFQGWPV